jgi:hypothetical protein
MLNKIVDAIFDHTVVVFRFKVFATLIGFIGETLKRIIVFIYYNVIGVTVFRDGYIFGFAFFIYNNDLIAKFTAVLLCFN